MISIRLRDDSVGCATMYVNPEASVDVYRHTLSAPGSPQAFTVVFRLDDSATREVILYESHAVDLLRRLIAAGVRIPEGEEDDR